MGYLLDTFASPKLTRDLHAWVESRRPGFTALRPNWKPPSAPPPIVRTVATRAEGVDDLLAELHHFLSEAAGSGALRQRRTSYWRERILAMVRERLLAHILPQAHSDGALAEAAEAVAARRSDPFSASEAILRSEVPSSGSSHRSDKGQAKRDRADASIVLDHLGVAVQSLEEAVRFYKGVLGLKVSGYETIAAEKTKVAMIPLGESRIELLEATATDSPIARFLAKRGPGLHHICLRVPDLAAAVARLKQSGALIINEAPGVGAGGHRYVFIHPSSAGGVLLELVESEPRS